MAGRVADGKPRQIVGNRVLSAEYSLPLAGRARAGFAAQHAIA